MSRKQPPQKFEKVVVTKAGRFREWALSTPLSRVSGTPFSPLVSLRLLEKGEKITPVMQAILKTVEGGR